MPLPEVVPCLLVWFRQMASGQQQCEVPAMTRRKPWIFNDFNGTDGIYQDTYRHFNNLQVLFLTWSRQGLRITCSVQWNNEKQKYTAVEERQVLRDVRSVTTVETASFHIPKKSPCCCWPGCRSLMLRKGRAKVARQAGCDPESLRVRPANCSLYLLVTSSESTPNLCHFHVPCDRMHSILILACSCFVATWDLFCLGDTSDNCFVSGLPCLIFSWNWRLFFVPPFCSVSETTWVWQEDWWENSKFMFSFNPNTYEQSSKKHSGRISLSCFACPSAHNLPNFKHVVCGPWTTAYFYNILVIGFS